MCVYVSLDVCGVCVCVYVYMYFDVTHCLLSNSLQCPTENKETFGVHLRVVGDWTGRHTHTHTHTHTHRKTLQMSRNVQINGLTNGHMHTLSALYQSRPDGSHLFCPPLWGECISEKPHFYVCVCVCVCVCVYVCV